MFAFAQTAASSITCPLCRLQGTSIVSSRAYAVT